MDPECSRDRPQPPPFVYTDEQRRRWDLAVDAAANLLGLPPTAGVVVLAARALFVSDIPTAGNHYPLSTGRNSSGPLTSSSQSREQSDQSGGLHSLGSFRSEQPVREGSIRGA